jgi:hypothetical protein
MTPAQYIARSLLLFPCRSDGGPRLQKTPLTPNGFKDASIDFEVVRHWEQRYPACLWGMPTGTTSGYVVLDIDVKRPGANGFDSLEDLGHSILPETPLAHTQSGGVHVYFQCPNRELRNSAGKIGAGLDVRGDGGYVIVPTPDSGYRWDTYWNLDTVKPVAAPDWLWPAPPVRPRMAAPPKFECAGLSRYAEAALDAACSTIIRAPGGQQEATLNTEVFSIGTLAAVGGIPETIALTALLAAANRMPNHDPAWPWRWEELDFKVRRAFRDGLAHPRREASRVG